MPNTIASEALSFQEVKPYLAATKVLPQFLQASDGVLLAYYAFLPQHRPKAAVIFYHGSGMWSNGMYQQVAHELANNHAIATYLFDIRGHGNSEGIRGDAPTAEHVWKDINSAISLVQQAHPGLPVFLGGHSSGAGLIVNYSAWANAQPVDGYLLLSPFLGGDSGTLNPEQKFVTKVRTWVFIAQVITGLNYFNHLQAVYFNYPAWLKEQDNKILESSTCAIGLATTPYDAKSIFEKMTTKFGLFVGSQDEQFIPEKLIAYKDHATKVKDKSLASIVPNTNHLSIILHASEVCAQAIKTFLAQP